MQFPALPAMKKYTATPLPRPREGAARPQRPPTKMGPAGPIKGDLHTFRGPQAPEQGKHVPEVGLELHSSPCKHWAPAETCRIRPSPTHIRRSQKPKVCTLYTLQIAQFKGLRPRSPIRGAAVLYSAPGAVRNGIPVSRSIRRPLPRRTEGPLSAFTITYGSGLGRGLFCVLSPHFPHPDKGRSAAHGARSRVVRRPIMK